LRKLLHHHFWIKKEGFHWPSRPEAKPMSSQENIYPATLPTPVSDNPDHQTSESRQTLEQTDWSGVPSFLSPIPGYRLKPEIARGGMGIVYAADCLTFGREVAIKVMKPHMSVAVFNREARITARLPHPGIPPVHALGALAGGQPYLVMKLIRGETLERILKKSSDLTGERGRLLAAFEQICQAVGYAHSKGIIHRDLKPSNVMVGAFGEVQVMDWGLAKEISGSEDSEGESVEPEPGLTVAGQLKGTPAYMAPEQARGEEVNARADVFALGGILAAILTGHPPFEGSSVMDTVARAARCDLGETMERLGGCGADPELVGLCGRCLSEEPSDRPADGSELASIVAGYRAEVEKRLIQAERERAAHEAMSREQENTRREAEEKLAERIARKRTQLALASAVALLALAGVFGRAVWLLWAKADNNHKEAAAAHILAEESKARIEVFEYGGTIRLAHQEWRDGRNEIMLNLLNGTDSALRGWEWRYLNRLNESSRHVLKGHAGFVVAAALSEDAARAVTGSEDETAKIWDVNSGKEILALKGHKGGVNAVAFSRDGRFVVTGSGDFGQPGQAKIWDSKKGGEILLLSGHKNAIKAASFSHDGGKVVTGSRDQTAKVWDAVSGANLLTLTGHRAGITAASFSRDGGRIVTGSMDGTARIWDAATGTTLLTLEGHAEQVLSACFSGDGARVATGSLDHKAKLWDAVTGMELLSLDGHAGGVASIAFSADGKRLVTGSFDHKAKLWDAVTGIELLNLEGHEGEVRAACFSGDGKRVLTGSSDRTARVWLVDPGDGVHAMRAHDGGLGGVVQNASGSRLATLGIDKTARVWNAATGRQVFSLSIPGGGINGVSFSNDGTRIVTAGDDAMARVWDATTGTEQLSLRGHRAPARAAAFSPEGSRIATGGDDKALKNLGLGVGQGVAQHCLRRHPVALVGVQSGRLADHGFGRPR
jgi:WD40 repeat protein/serine/threonine protein kinase